MEERPGSLKEVYEVKILLCYLLRHIPRPLTHAQLLEIAAEDNLINYFLLADAVEGLLGTGQIVSETPPDGGEPVYVLTDRGAAGADEFKGYVPRALRDRIVDAALRLFTRIKRDEEVKCEILELDDGCHVHCRLLDLGSDLLDVKIFAPDMEQAKLIRRKLLADPTAFYSKLIDFCLDNDENIPS